MKQKGRILLVMVLALALVMSLAAVAQADDYSNHWSAPFIKDAAARGWMTGDGNGNFRPESPITRGEFAVMLWRALNEPAPKYACPFKDVPENAFYYKAVVALFEAKVTSGLDDTTFGPLVTLTREMGCTMLAKAFQLSPVNANAYQKFADSLQVSDWAQAAVSSLVEKEYIAGVGDNKIAPKQQLKRGELAKLLTTVFDGVKSAQAAAAIAQVIGGPTITVKQIPQGSDEVTIAVTTESSVGIKYVGWRDSSSKDATYKNNDSFTSLGTTGHAEFTVDKNGWYAIYAENKSSYSNYKVFEVTTIKEDAPKVSLKQVASSSSEVEVTVTATPTISGAVISSLAWRTSSEGANYSSKAGFNNNISLVDKMFKVTSNGWYAVGAEDDKGNFGYKLIEIKSINKGKTMAPVITTTSLPDGTDGVAYSQTLKANGDTPITWSIIGGALPDGLTLNPTTGAITGTPTVVKIFDFTVKAENGTGPDATKDLSIEIVAAPTPIGFTEITYAAGDPAPLAGVIKEGEPTSGYTPPVVTANTGYTVTSAGWISGVDGGDNFDTAPGPAKYTIVLTANSNYAFTGTGLNDTNFATDEATVSIDYNAPTAVLTITYSFAIAAP